MAIRIGTSGWMYDAWKNNFYEGVKKKDWLGYAAARFKTLEIDSTFYRQQSPETYAKWSYAVPDDFLFSVRGHRYISHRKKLIDVRDSIVRVKEQASGLGPKLGPMLWQIPPFMRKNADRLRTFCSDLQELWPEARHAFEARHESWFEDEIRTILSDHNMANTISDAASFPRWDATSADFVYVRLHGKPHTYWSRYEDAQLEEWAARIRTWHAEGRDVFVYFDNDANGHAPWDALRLMERTSNLSRNNVLLI